ncbi:hypothetical protein ACFVHB_13825 [Kitasatospora sp. NPDC127111]|uniref:hypothetical protein n=1 Tax=Kitasatospora sp. NPDC127111 TaxID=3345363 RepID=UPI0036434A9E
MTAPLSSPDPTDGTDPTFGTDRTDGLDHTGALDRADGPSGPPGAHPSVDELADLAEGLVEPAAAAEALHAHLAGCAECRETAEALTEVQALLGAVEPPAMPEDVAARLDAALAAAAAEPPPVPAEGPDAPQEAAAPADRSVAPTGPSRPVPAPFPASTRPPGRPTAASTSTGPGRPRTRRRRFALLVGAAAVLLGAGLGGSLLFSSADQRASDTAAVSAGTPAAGVMPGGTPRSAKAETGAGPGNGGSSTGGTVYRDDQLAAQVQQLLARTGATPDGPAKPSRPSGAASEAPPTDGQQGIAGEHGATTCPPPADGRLLATDTGSYGGAPVEVLVYAAPGQPGQLDVYLRAAGCGPVLLQRTVPAR